MTRLSGKFVIASKYFEAMRTRQFPFVNDSDSMKVLRQLQMRTKQQESIEAMTNENETAGKC